MSHDPLAKQTKSQLIAYIEEMQKELNKLDLENTKQAKSLNRQDLIITDLKIQLNSRRDKIKMLNEQLAQNPLKRAAKRIYKRLRRYI